MLYKDLENFELFQLIRILSQDYQDIKYSFEMLNRGILLLHLDLEILKKYKTFKNSLEKELRKIEKEVGEDRLKDFLFLFPTNKIKKPRGRKKSIKISKKYKN